jgi:protein-tyrosine phosphatase
MDGFPARGLVDTHSHVVPSGDDGVRSVDEGVTLVLEAAARGTAVQFATPHAMSNHPVTPARRARVADAARLMRAQLAGRVELRLGWEVGPQAWVLDEDPREFRLEGLDACLLELPLPHTRPRDLRLFLACAEHVQRAGLMPLLGHPERCPLVAERPHTARELSERGWLLQVNGSSLLGVHGRDAERTGWWLIEHGLADVVGSDGHRAARPPFLDAALQAVEGRIGAERARPLFTGAALHRLESLKRPA